MKYKAIGIMFAVMLTARLGVYRNGSTGLTETWYNRSMNRVVTTAQDKGIPCEYWVRDDGVKMFGQWVIVAAHPSVTRYTFVETSLGTGIEVVPVTRSADGKPIIMICNEEGKIKGLEHNMYFMNDEIVGTIFLCSVEGDELTDLPQTFGLAEWKKLVNENKWE